VTVLLDSSVVVALLADEHQHHEAASRWLAGLDDQYATCPISQGAAVRYTLRRGRSAVGALHALHSLVRTERHEFWPDDVEFLQVRVDGVVGHRLVTDAYLAELARRHDGRLATLDRGLADLHADVAELVPTS
jgi:uncharacterized protein